MTQGLPATLLLAACLLAGAPASAAPVEFHSGPRTFRIDPATLRVDLISGAGKSLHLVDPVAGLGAPADVSKGAASARWRLPKAGYTIEAGLVEDLITVRITADRPGAVVWPVITPDASVRALILPRSEGSWIPVRDEGWLTELAGYSNALIEEWSLPCFGLDLGGQTVTYLIPIPFNTEVTYPRRDDRLGVAFRHTFTRLDAARQFGIVIKLGGASPITPALIYRDWMVRHHQLVTLAEKIKIAPRAERLAGALHAYLWGAYLRPQDIKDWKGLCRLLSKDGPRDKAGPAGRVWKLLAKEAQAAAREGAQGNGPYDYLRDVITRDFDRIIQSPSLPEGSGAGLQLHERCAANARWLAANFPDQFNPPETWGDGISVKMLKALTAIGVDRALLVGNDLHAGDRRPEVAVEADRLGFLYGPYDGYESMHSPSEKDTWDTAQFGKELYETGGILGENGKPRKGFQQKGRHLSAIAARPYVEARVRGLEAVIPYSAWFVDGDAFGQWYDDYSPAHPASQAQDLAARLSRLKWIAETFGITVGSEGGVALTSSAICFAHGMLTPALGWGDKDLKNQHSKYWLGGYWPPEAPAVFFKQVPLKPKYFRPIYDPQYRLPLYEVALHDCVVATHQWGFGSLKFKDLRSTVALTEQLYNLPPLYHLNLAELERERGAIAAGYRFFSPLHRHLAYQPMTGFRWLTDDRLVQETTFGDGTILTANFRPTATTVDGLELPAESITSRREGVTTTFRPGKDTVSFSATTTGAPAPTKEDSGKE